jgi:hypothetical protein
MEISDAFCFYADNIGFIMIAPTRSVHAGFATGFRRSQQHCFVSSRIFGQKIKLRRSFFRETSAFAHIKEIFNASKWSVAQPRPFINSRKGITMSIGHASFNHIRPSAV